MILETSVNGTVSENKDTKEERRKARAEDLHLHADLIMAHLGSPYMIYYQS